MEKALKTIIFMLIIAFPQLIHAAIDLNKLLDIGTLNKRDGKAVMLIFNNPTKKKDWKIKFSGKQLNITLMGFKSDIKKGDINLTGIPAINDTNILKKNNSIIISFILKEDIKSLLNDGYLTFLTKDPHMLGIMFTRSYLSKITSQRPAAEKIDNEPKKAIAKQNKEKASDKALKTTKKVNDKSIDLPFISYEDLSATNKKNVLHNTDNKILLKAKDKKKMKKEALPKKEKKRVEGFVIKRGNAIKKKKSFMMETQKKGNDIQLFKIIASLSAVLGIVIISLFSWKKLLLLKYKGNQKLIKILGMHHFGSRQSIAIIQIEKDKFLVGITPESISLLTKLDIQDPKIDYGQITGHKLSEEDNLSQRAVNMLKEKFDQLKRV